MNNILKIIAASATLTSCAWQSGDECHIHGTLPSDKWDGQYVFFVPMYDKDSIGVDSTKIKGNEFDFTTSKSAVSDIRLSWRTRLGIESHLVAYEPGCVDVHLDTLSSGGGTPQNDSLQAWKNRALAFQKNSYQMMTAYRNSLAANDTATSNRLKSEMRKARDEYRKETIRLADDMAGTPLAIFMNGRVLGREKYNK